MTTQKMIHHCSCRYSCSRLFLMVLSIILLMAAGGILGCSDSSGGSTPAYHLTGYDGMPGSASAASVSFLDAGNSGLTFYAQAPWYVNMTLQVTDQKGFGVSGLQAADFSITENDVQLDTITSNTNLRKRMSLPSGYTYRLKTVLLVDNSANVSPEIYVQILAGALTIVENMDEKGQQEIAIVAFDNDGAPALIRDFTSNSTQLKPYLTLDGTGTGGTGGIFDDILNPNPTSSTRVIKRSLGTADFYGAVKFALNLWKEDPSPMVDEGESSKILTQGFVVAITQGRDTAGLYDVNEAIAHRDQDNKRIVTVPVGSNIPSDILSDMERLGNGWYYPVPKTDKEEILEQIKTVQQRMIAFADGFYWIQYKSKQSGAAGARRDHIVEIAVSDNPNTGDNATITGNFSSKDFISGEMGVYFNATAANPSGTGEVTFLVERGQAAGSATEDVSALTYSRITKAPSQFTWTSLDTDVITVTPKSGSGGANAVITAYEPGETSIRVTDTANSVSMDLNVKVVVREFSYEILNHVLESAFPSSVDATFQVRETDPDNNQWKWITNMKREEFLLLENKGTAIESQVDREKSEVHLRKRDRMPSDYSYILKTVLLIDNSPSTLADGYNLEVMKEAAKAFVERAFESDPNHNNYNKGPLFDVVGRKQQQIAIWSFSEMGDSQLIQGFTNDRERIEAAIDSIPPGYSAINFYGGMVDALRLWQNNQAPHTGGNQLQQGVLVALTDGHHSNVGFGTKEAVLNEIRDNKQVICVGVGDDLVTRANINDLKTFGNAGYYSVPNPSAELEQTLRIIQDEIVDFADSFYWLNYKSYADKAGNCANTTDLDISIINNSNTIQKSISGEFETCDFWDGMPGMIYVNSTSTNPEGENTFEMRFLTTDNQFFTGSSKVTLKASTYMPENTSVFRWTSLTPAVVSVEAITSTYGHSEAIIRLPANPREGTGQIQVRDIGNNTQKILLVNVEKTDIPPPVAYYPFNGNAVDATGNGYDGETFGPRLVTDRHGNPDSAYWFNGTTDYIALQMFYGPDDGSHSWAGETIPEISVGAWVNSSSNKDQFIVAFDRSEYWRLALKDQFGENVGWDVTNPSRTSYDLRSSIDYADGTWHFIVATYDSSNTKIYVDGQEVARMGVSEPIGTGMRSWGFIGVGSEARNYNGSKMLPGTRFGDTLFMGAIDDVMIFHHVLTPEQISILAELW